MKPIFITLQLLPLSIQKTFVKNVECLDSQEVDLPPVSLPSMYVL